MHKSMRKAKSVGCGPDGNFPQYDGRSAPSAAETRSSHQVSALLRRPEAMNKEAPGTIIRHRRAKRYGYTHVAAQPSKPGLLELPEGGCHINPLKVKEKLDPSAVQATAGISSDKQDKMMDWIDDLGVPTVKPVYYPSSVTDPIAHRADPTKCTVMRDETTVQGAAGVGTKRLNTLATGIGLQAEFDGADMAELAQHDKHRQNDGARRADHDIIAHRDEPAPKQKPMKKQLDSSLYRTRITTTHRGGKPVDLPLEDYVLGANQKVVKSGEKYLVFAAGNEDLAPAATNPYVKSEYPPSREHRIENDKRYLHSFDGARVKKGAPFGGNPRQLESNDMDYIMGGRKDSTPPYNGCKNPTGDTRWGGTNFPVPYPQGEEGNRTQTPPRSTRSLQAPRLISGVYPDGQRARSQPRQASNEIAEGYPRESERRRQRSMTPPRGDYGEMFDRTRIKSSKDNVASSRYSPRRSQTSFNSGVSGDSRARYAWASPDDRSMR